MLFKLSERQDSLRGLIPVGFHDLLAIGKQENNLENLIADHLLDTLFEDGTLMPLFQERSWQAEADNYAFDRDGNLVIFKLKRGHAGADAMLQVLGYAQGAGQWAFGRLQDIYRSYTGRPNAQLPVEHRDAFGLERTLQPSEFNKKQRLLIVCHAANDELVDAVAYWQRQGLDVSFLPYRLYQFGNDWYFAFHAPPSDRHANPALRKGVIFDTNRNWDEDAVWAMIGTNRVSAYGDAKEWCGVYERGDFVFYSHRYVGIIAAAEVVGPMKSDGPEECYRDVRFITLVPKRSEGIIRYLSFSDTIDAVGKSFFHAYPVKADTHYM